MSSHRLPNDRIERYLTVIAEKRLCSSRSNWASYLAYLFDDVDFTGKRVLDIGGGEGVISFYAGAAGAADVICLEPEAAGSRDDMNRIFADLRDSLDFGIVNQVRGTFQEFDPADRKFGVVILHNSINHLEEDACTRILKDPAARDLYIAQFKRLYEMSAPGAQIVITDCARSNFFGLLGRRSPFAKSITWNLHQSPRTWAGLLRSAGFTQPRIRWTTFNRLGPVGAALLRNRLAAYMLTSRFALTVRKGS